MGKLNKLKERLGQWQAEKVRNMRARAARQRIRRAGSLEDAIGPEDTKPQGRLRKIGKRILDIIEGASDGPIN